MMRLGLRSRLNIAFLFTAIFILSLSSLLFYKEASSYMLEQVREQLRVQAATSALYVDAENLKKVRSESDAAYLAEKKKLKQIRASIPSIRDVYTFKPNSSTTWTFLVDSMDASDKKLFAPLGTTYDIKQDGAIAQALTRSVSSRELYHDEYGNWLSGYAPIRDASGQTVAVIGIDMEADRYLDELLRIKIGVVFVFIIGLIVSFFTSLLMAKQIADPEEVRKKVVEVELEKKSVENERVKGALSRYLSERVANTLLESGIDHLEGVRRTVTLMFTDIRGFTTLSEAMQPEETVSLLNSYFSRMVDIVFQYDGMLDKYMGDGMMVIFGAPIPCEDHAWRAVLTALKMREELKVLNAERKAAGLPPLSIGIGIHTGECIVGNIGSKQRIDYTAIGNVVNTASRVESMTKEYGLDILMSIDTYLQVKDKVKVRPIEEVYLKGKTAPLDLFALETLAFSATMPLNRITPSGTYPEDLAF